MLFLEKSLNNQVNIYNNLCNLDHFSGKKRGFLTLSLTK